MTDPAALVKLARQIYASDDVEIDEEARISVTENGFWVQAWVWVPDATEKSPENGA